MEQNQFLQYIAIAGMVINALSLVFYLLQAWGLYLINKKLGEEYAWLAFIPVIQIYSFVKAAGKDPIWIVWLILGTILFFIPGLIIAIILTNEISKRTGNGVGTTILMLFFPFIMYPIIGSRMPEGYPSSASINL